MKRLIVFSLLLSLAAGLPASTPSTTKKIYVATPINPHPPTIDGRLDDEVWQKAEWTGDFVQREPNDGVPPSQQTAFKVLYDESNLYVGIRAYDSEPEKIVSRVTRRDSFDGDWVEINIDSYFDHRTAFSFTLNAAGVKGDEAISSDGDYWDSNWNPIWFCDVARDNEGWTAEMRIPFNQLRFANKDEHVWGMQVTRKIYRFEERSVWQYIPKNTGGWVSYFGELHGLKGIKSSSRIELMPYGVSDVRTFPKEAGNPFSKSRETNFSGGLDAKMGVTSDLTLDVTVNPDFGQVEADPSEVNLTAFETFFPEKRPFFIEGQNILDYKIMGGDGSFSNDRLFYSRRIGRAPQHFPDLANNEYSVAPSNTSIISAMKLTGKTHSGWSIGVLDAITERENALIDLNGQRREETVEPLTNYFVGRLQKDFNKGNTAFGGIFTATHRDLDQQQIKFLNREAYSGGLDFFHQWQNKTYYLDVRTAFSQIRGDREAILEAQTASARYYQRPDADYVTLDSSRTSLTGHGGMVSFGRSGNGILRMSAGAMWRSPGLELNDLGFLRQADRVMQWTWMGYNSPKSFAIFRSLRGNFNQWWGWDFGGETVFGGGNVNGGGQFGNYWWFWMGFGYEGKNLSTSALRGGPAMKFPGYWNQWYELTTDNRKAVQLGVNGNNSWADAGSSRFHRISLWANFRPRDSILLRVNPFYSINKDDLQYVGVDSVFGNLEAPFLFGRLDQKTLGIVIRLDLCITPDLSIQYYGQPFISAGKYLNFKRITQPRAERYADRFHTFAGNEVQFDAGAGVFNFDEGLNGTTDYSRGQPDFNFRQFRSNFVVRWEYQPGSTLFLVWTQERTNDSFRGGNFSYGNDLEDLFDTTGTNVFLVKVSKWFSL
ncbi:MAG TPA: DUF5916 domain-containing protein [bacterium]